MTTPQSPTVTTDLKRELSLLDAIMINTGTMIASAIFIVPATVAAAVQGTAVMTLVWVIGGIVSLLGALSIAELAAAYPEAGGQYAYLREAYGTVWAFLYGWANFAVINTASIAAIAVGFARYIGFFTPLSEAAIRIIAILSILALTLLNCRGVRLGATTQNILTTLKIGALLALVATSFILPGGSASQFQPLWPTGTVGQWIGPFGVAMVAVLWAYDGWIETTYVGSEIVDPGRNLPRSIIYSTLIVIALYVLASVAYAFVLSPAGMAGSALVASDAAKVTIGSLGATLVVVAILISTLGANNGIILTAARIPYAMARGGMFFRSQGIVHPRYATPTVALLTQGAVAATLTAFGTYDQLFTYVVFAQFVFYALSAGAVIKLRRTAPQLARPYRTWGYPVTPIVFIAFAAWLVYNTIVETPLDSAVGAGIILLGLPGYWYWRKGGSRR
jgi:basic amino acid/polyamine antiporter, APA family